MNQSPWILWDALFSWGFRTSSAKQKTLYGLSRRFPARFSRTPGEGFLGSSAHWFCMEALWENGRVNKKNMMVKSNIQNFSQKKWSIGNDNLGKNMYVEICSVGVGVAVSLTIFIAIATHCSNATHLDYKVQLSFKVSNPSTYLGCAQFRQSKTYQPSTLTGQPAELIYPPQNHFKTWLMYLHVFCKLPNLRCIHHTLNVWEQSLQNSKGPRHGSREPRTIHSAARSTQSRPRPGVVPFWLVHLVPIFSTVTILQELSYFETMPGSNVSRLKKIKVWELLH